MSKDTFNIADTVGKLRDVKRRQADLQQEEHRLFSELLTQIDETIMNQIKDQAFGTDAIAE